MRDFWYRRFCPLARALDLIGQRWTLVILDTLSLKPCRYRELKRDLPNIGSNVLSQRLRTLEAAGVVQRRAVPHPDTGTVYELTERGRELEPVLRGLRAFGMGILALSSPTDPDEPACTYDMSHAIPPGWKLDESYQWEIDDRVFHLTVKDTRLEQRPGRATRPVATLRTSLRTLERVAGGELSWSQAAQRKLVTTRGSRAAIERMFRVTGEPTRRLGLAAKTPATTARRRP